MLDELTHRLPQMPRTKWHDVVQTLGLDGENEALCERVKVGAARGQPDRLHAMLLENAAELFGEERIAVDDEVAVVFEEAVEDVDQVSRYLRHP